MVQTVFAQDQAIRNFLFAAVCSGSQARERLLNRHSLIFRNFDQFFMRKDVNIDLPLAGFKETR